MASCVVAAEDVRSDDVRSIDLEQTQLPCLGPLQRLDVATGNCYTLFTTVSSWDEAVLACSSLPGDTHLADVTGDSEFRLVAELRLGNIREAWLAGSDRDVEGTWIWTTTGEAIPLGAPYWAEGEPDQRVQDENCLAIQAVEEWHDRRCDARFGYICEREAAGIPGQPGTPGQDGNQDDPDMAKTPDDDLSSLYACAVAPPGAVDSTEIWWAIVMVLGLVARRVRGCSMFGPNRGVA